VSVFPRDIEFVDAYARSHGVKSRSAVLQEALAMLRARDLGNSYLAAWEEWSEDGAEDAAWEATVADGLGPR